MPLRAFDSLTSDYSRPWWQSRTVALALFAIGLVLFANGLRNIRSETVRLWAVVCLIAACVVVVILARS